MPLVRINYDLLSAPQKEAYNFQKVSAVLADYGFCTIRLSDDWNGADFIAQHIDGSFLPVQLKGRLTFKREYLGKQLWECFPDEGHWYLFPHDSVFADVKNQKPTLEFTDAWARDGEYHFPKLDPDLRAILSSHLIA